MEGTPQLHKIEDDLSKTWIEDFASDGIKDIETYLGKHALFLDLHPETEPELSSSDEPTELSGGINVD